jgi:hypothetical protein
MTLHPKVRKFLSVSLKHAVNAVLTNAGLMGLMHGAFNMYSRNGWWNLGKATAVVIGAREAAIWLPVLLKWSMTNADPSQLQDSLTTAAAATAKASDAIADAQTQAPKSSQT